MATRKRPNPAVGYTERAAKLSQDMADMAANIPNQSSLGQQIANKKRATADKVKKRPYLIERD